MATFNYKMLQSLARECLEWWAARNSSVLPEKSLVNIFIDLSQGVRSTRWKLPLCANGSHTVRRHSCRLVLFPHYGNSHSWYHFPRDLYAVMQILGFFFLLFCLSNRLQAFVHLIRHQHSTLQALSCPRNWLREERGGFALCVGLVAAHPRGGRPFILSLQNLEDFPSSLKVPTN